MAGATGKVIEFQAAAGTTYAVDHAGDVDAHSRFEGVSGTPATSARRLGPVQIGLFAVSQVCTHQGAFFENSDGPQMREHGWRALLDKLGQALAA